MLQNHLITPLVRAGAVSQDNAHPFILDPASPDRGAGRYERVLARHGFRYDIILLSAGFEKLFLLLLDCVTRAVTGEVPQC